MRRIFLIFIFVFFATAGQTETVTMGTYHPSVFGSYDRLRLVPRTNVSAVNCTAQTVGTLYTETGLGVYYCILESSVPVWRLMDVPWRRQGNNVYLRDSAASANANLKVGIGTQNPDFQLTVKDGVLLSRGTSSSPALTASPGTGPRFLWYPRKAVFRVGYNTSTNWDDAQIGNNSTVLGGHGNRASQDTSTAVGGQSNQANGVSSTVTGGTSNIASGASSVISGGTSNQVSGTLSVIMGGNTNQNTGNFATMLGGNTNTLQSLRGVLAGGNNNAAIGTESNVFGGQNNSIPIPGFNNTFIYGGSGNSAQANFGNIFGGASNTVSAVDSTILAGNFNTITGAGSSNIFGGQNNRITASSNNSIFAGENNQIINTSIGNIILGGTNNIINTNFAIAGGSNIRIENDIADAIEMFTFAWGNPGAAVSITQGNSFIAYVSKFGVNVPNPTRSFEFQAAPGKIAYVTNTGDWCNAAGECLSADPPGGPSDRNLKRNIKPIKGVLEKLSRLQGVTFYWNERYKWHSLATVQQIGFIAQKVEKVFPQWVRENAEGIKKLNTDEMDAVIVEAIKELNTLVDTEASKYDALLDAKMKDVEELSAELNLPN